MGVLNRTVFEFVLKEVTVPGYGNHTYLYYNFSIKPLERNLKKPNAIYSFFNQSSQIRGE